MRTSESHRRAKPKARGSSAGANDAGITVPKRVAIYTRKSTEKGLKAELTSIDVQREACESYLRGQHHLGWRCLAARYDDGGYTGANMERPAMQKLMADVEAGKVDVVLVYKLDRLSRSIRDFVELVEYLDDRGVSFASVEHNFSTANAIGRLVLHMLVSFAQFEREMIVERVTDRVRSARRRGKWTGGKAPLGYQVVDKKLSVDAAWAPLACDVLRMWAASGSAQQVANRLNAAGRHRPRRLREGEVDHRKWRKNDVLAIVKSPYYGGQVPVGEDEYVQGEHEPLIDAETYAAVRARVDALNERRERAGRSEEYLLRGLLRCGNCGAAMTGASTQKPDGKIYRYYRCTTRDQCGRDACPTRPFAAGPAEEHVVGQLRQAVRVNDVVRRLPEIARATLEARTAEIGMELEGLAQVIESKTVERLRLVESFAEAAPVMRRGLDELVARLDDELTTAELRRAELQSHLAAAQDATIEMEWIASMLADFDAIWGLLTIGNQARLLRGLVARVETRGVEQPLAVHLVDTGLVDALVYGEVAPVAG